MSTMRPFSLYSRPDFNPADTTCPPFSKGLPHTCQLPGCHATASPHYPLCARHGLALKAADHRLLGRINGRFNSFHHARWLVQPKALALYRILLHSAARKLKMTEPSSTNP